MQSTHLPKFDSLPEYFYHWVKTKPNFPFLRQPKDDHWKIITYQQAYDEAAKMATALQGLGLQKGDHIAIYSKNCYHWILADMAIMMGGYVSIPLYHNLSARQLKEVLRLSHTKAIFVGKLDQWGKRINSIANDVQMIRFPQYENNAPVTQGSAWDTLVADNSPTENPNVPDPDDLWTIMFTSGTTGTPKGVMHVHGTPAKIIKDEVKNNWLGTFNHENPRLLSYLPLNHVGEKIGVHAMALTGGGTISFAESLETFAKNLQDTQPTVFFAVPRIWTKFYLGVASKMPLHRQKLLFKIPILGNRIKKKIRYGLGMSDIRVAATGAAITPANLKEWYKSLGIHLVEAYGMTEVCGSFTNSPMKNAPSDSVGKVVPGAEIKIDPETNEVLMKTPYMMTGYYNEPELTAKVLKDGWLHSGDKGTVDANGFVRIIGRVSDAFKTSKGKFVSPNPIEEALAKNEVIEQVCIAGLGIPQPIALVNLSEIGQAMSKEEVENALVGTLSHVNAKLANYQRVSTCIVDQNTWSPENALLTPTLKVRRGELDTQYAQRYADWHNDQKGVIWI
ncbi:MAG: AMP-binding protein [Bacteroidota bacterium]